MIGEGSEGRPDPETLRFYDANAAEYAAWSGPASPQEHLRKFISLLPPGGAALDLGCGSGWAAAAMRDAGLETTAMDASRRLAAEARAQHGIEVETAEFASLADVARFDGVWASFSLLHAPREAMPGHLARIRRALKPGGLVYVGMKGGQGDMRDRHGRFYALYEAGELLRLIGEAGFHDADLAEQPGAGYDGVESPNLHLFARTPSTTEPADG